MTESNAQPVSRYGNDELARMHKELTDDEYIAEAKRKNDVKMRVQDKIADTGL